jgi:hypothetical protein
VFHPSRRETRLGVVITELGNAISTTSEALGISLTGVRGLSYTASISMFPVSVLLKGAAQQVYAALVNSQKSGFRGNVSAAHSSFRHPFRVAFGIASGDKHHLNAKAVLRGPARLFESNSRRVVFKRKS